MRQILFESLFCAEDIPEVHPQIHPFFFNCFKFCSAVSNSVLLFGPEVMRKLDFIIYDNCNTLSRL